MAGMTQDRSIEFQRLSAFSDGKIGGNPAGVVLSGTMPDDRIMQDVAAEVGYSETVFLQPDGDAWRTRYFSTEAEVPFCGHATIAAGAAAAAFGGYLRDGGLSDVRRFTIIQGETMGQRSILQVDATGPAGSGITVAGTVRCIDDALDPPSLKALG